MSNVKTSGSATSALKVVVDIETVIEGKSTIRLGDGTVIEGPSKQRFERIVRKELCEGDWLINPATNETHKVVRTVGVGVDLIAITTEKGQVAVTWADVIETLLLVVNE